MCDTTAGAVAVYRQGLRAGPEHPVVLLHGNGHSFHEFDRVLPYLGEERYIIGWDMPGHGASAAANACLSIEARADILDACLANETDRPVVLAGNSIGAFIAAGYATRRPERVRALLLCELQVRTRGWWDEAWPIVERMFGADTQDFDSVQSRLESPLDETILSRWNADRARAGSKAMIAAMAAIRDCDIIDLLGRIRVPTTLLYGAAGPALDSAEAAQRALPLARCEVVAASGHFLTIDQPATFASAVTDLATQTAAPTGSG